MQCNSSKEGDIEIRASSGSELLGRDVQALHRVKCSERTPRVPRELQLPIESIGEYGLVIAIVHHEKWALWKGSFQLPLELLPG